ncbi:hypothetical protein [Thiobacter aerophilum]|uniref:Glycoside hydrolase family 57 N-terminal domain-containing protein n=1 Tax=Thiobacter aerophilum TaxID=3121275 RepID=A0ABV0EH45_9BURK
MNAARLLSVWREPALTHPVLVLESDDWGADAPGRVAEQARALYALIQVLRSIRDATGRSAVMTIGLVSGIIDREVWRKTARYVRLTLDHPSQAAVREALESGIAAGVFAIQWHGLEHYWPPALLASRAQPAVRRWLEQEAPTEALPDALQSRWVDGSVLPTQAIAGALIEQAIAEEAACLRRCFGRVPTVAVPNTFVWNDDVEAAWRRAGVEWVVTPGARHTGRDAQGRLLTDRRWLYNGAPSATGVRYLVRDVYFEPARGHDPQRLVSGLDRQVRAGRPCLVETHRFNYLGQRGAQAREALRCALEMALARYAKLRFAASEELGAKLLDRDADWVRPPRLAHCWTRLGVT